MISITTIFNKPGLTFVGLTSTIISRKYFKNNPLILLYELTKSDPLQGSVKSPGGASITQTQGRKCALEIALTKLTAQSL